MGNVLPIQSATPQRDPGCQAPSPQPARKPLARSRLRTAPWPRGGRNSPPLPKACPAPSRSRPRRARTRPRPPEIIIIAAGRLLPPAKRPTHPKGLVSIGPFTKQPSRPPAEVMLSGPVENDKDFQFMSPGAEAVRLLDQPRSDRFFGADRTACAGWEPRDRDRAPVRPHRTLRLTNANRDRS